MKSTLESIRQNSNIFFGTLFIFILLSITPAFALLAVYIFKNGLLGFFGKIISIVLILIAIPALISIVRFQFNILGNEKYNTFKKFGLILLCIIYNTIWFHLFRLNF